jgi:hypothetical protein
VNEQQTKAFDRAQQVLLDLPESERKDVLAALQYNGIFCWHCGYGSHEHPNADCQCWNDE